MVASVQLENKMKLTVSIDVPSSRACFRASLENLAKFAETPTQKEPRCPN